VASIVSVPLCGYLSDRTGKPNWFIVGGSMGATLACLFVPYIAPPIIWILMFGTIRGGCTGGLMSLPSRVLSPESRNTGFAVVSAAYFICMTAFPAIAGWLLDWTGRPDATMWFAALLWFLITVLLGVFLLLERLWPPRCDH
jgi:MFS family permease